ncbi:MULTISPECIES: hypothetical protein [unclassified Meridianimarinicoccus]|uniref:hypothetical protein n=1 Tax=unclassified Meridianimarinicoccus TaxID=2923344 RepID=UPI001868FC6B|nr:hypothetical protein [Fluviibacterium sp. MJW13]
MILSFGISRPLILLALCGTLAGCGNSLGGWFNTAPPDTLEPEDGYDPIVTDSRRPVATITDLRIAPSPGGVIVQANGLPPTQGYWDLELVRVGEDAAPASEIRLEFRARPPIGETAVGTAESRDLEVATFLSNHELAGVSRITVIGQSNSRTARR